jgi:hypothetical protein
MRFPPVGAIHELPLLVETASQLACKDMWVMDSLAKGSLGSRWIHN